MPSELKKPLTQVFVLRHYFLLLLKAYFSKVTVILLALKAALGFIFSKQIKFCTCLSEWVSELQQLPPVPRDKRLFHTKSPIRFNLIQATKDPCVVVFLSLLFDNHSDSDCWVELLIDWQAALREKQLTAALLKQSSAWRAQTRLSQMVTVICFWCCQWWSGEPNLETIEALTALISILVPNLLSALVFTLVLESFSLW